MIKKPNFIYILLLILVLFSSNLFANNIGPVLDLKHHKEFLKNRKDKAIYLGINTNINSFDDACFNKDRNWVRKDIDDFTNPNLAYILVKSFLKKNIINSFQNISPQV